MNWKATLAFAFAIQATAATAYAGDGAALSTAREVAKEGLLAYDAARYDEAVEKLSKAYAVVHVPTLALAVARALEKTGKWVAASEIYLEATRIPHEKGWSEKQDEAKREAESEREGLLARIPRLIVASTGIDLSKLTVSIDGVNIPRALLDSEQLVDPGERHIQGAFGSQIAKTAVLVKAADHARAVLHFTETADKPISSSVAAPSEDSSGRSAGEGSRSDAQEATSISPQRIAGWVTVSVGGAGLALGGITGLWAMSKRSNLLNSGNCDKDVSCTTGQAGDVNSYNSLRTVSSIGFIAGGVLAVTGVTLLLTAPKQEKKAAVGLWVGPRAAGIYGGF